ncbi:MAG: ABC transporter ATP-binding protein [Acidobacteriota bacterium]|jgi:ABC-type glutathione transport system ATPase component
MTPLLAIDGLTVDVPSPRGPVPVVREISFRLESGEILGLVGESGAGKSLSAYAMTGLLPPGVQVSAGRVLLDGADLLTLGESALRRIRGRRIAMVFQDPAAALNPTFNVGFQVAEAIRAHRRISRREARREVVRLLERVALPDARRRLHAYPHQLSGGQKQRVVLAMALACRPDVLLADEPTTALDVTTQAQILDLLEDLRRELGLAVLLITHDLPVVAETCDRVLVLHDGAIVERGTVEEVFVAPSHPHTRELVAAAADRGVRGVA